MEKQKIVCDIFRVPNEHFSAIADIAGQPEAPKVTKYSFYDICFNRSKEILFLFNLIQEPSDILLAAFAQVQSLTEALNEYIQIPQQIQPELLIKSASLCDDCYKNIEISKSHNCTQLSNTQTASTTTPTTVRNEHTSNSNSSQSPTTTTVINNELTDSTASIEPINTLPDDDGYCEIDEIRLPAIIKSSTVATVIGDPQRQSLVDTNETGDDHNTKKIADQQLTATTPNDIKQNLMHDTPNATDAKSSNGNAAAIAVPSEHIEVNLAYDSMNQSLTELHLNETGEKRESNDVSRAQTCDQIRLPETKCAVPSIPCHLISAYVAALNLHISQLLVSIILISIRYFIVAIVEV